MTTLSQAQSIAETYLAASLPRRWSHVQSVGRRATDVAAQLLSPGDTELVGAAGWLHDIGYSPGIAETGFHPLDGARWLRSLGYDEVVVTLVAHHTCAIREARLRNLDTDLSTEFPNQDTPPMFQDIVWYSDLTTGPDGVYLDAQVRIAEIKERYGPGHIVTRFITDAESELIAAVERVNEALTRCTVRADS